MFSPVYECDNRLGSSTRQVLQTLLVESYEGDYYDPDKRNISG